MAITRIGAYYSGVGKILTFLPKEVVGAINLTPSSSSILSTVGNIPAIILSSTVLLSPNTTSLSSVGNIAPYAVGTVVTPTVYSSIVQSGIPTSSLGLTLTATNTVLQVQTNTPSNHQGASAAITRIGAYYSGVGRTLTFLPKDIVGTINLTPSSSSILSTVGNIPAIILGSTLLSHNTTSLSSVGNIATYAVGTVVTTTVHSSAIQSGIPTSSLGLTLTATNTVLQVQTNTPSNHQGIAVTPAAATITLSGNIPANVQGVSVAIVPLPFSVQATGNIPSSIIGSMLTPIIHSISTTSNIPYLLTGIVFMEYIRFNAYIYTRHSNLAIL